MKVNRRKFPRRCECGGKMVYLRDFGRVFGHCGSCTPVVEVKIGRPHRAVRKKPFNGPAERRT